MSTRFLFLAMVVMTAPGCTTFGVEYEDHILTASSSAPGIEVFQIDGMATEQALRIRGGALSFEGEMRVTGWFQPGVDHDIFKYISMYFDSEGATLTPRTLFHSQEVEHITVREASFDVRPNLDVWVDSVAGRVEVDTIVGDVTVNARGDVALSNVGGEAVVEANLRSVSARNVAGPVSIRGSAVTVSNTGPVDINATGTVRADIAHGGHIRTTSGSNVTVEVSEDAFDLLYIGAEDGDISVRLPSGSGWIIDIAGGHTAEDDDDDSFADEDGEVTVNVGDVYFNEYGYVSEVFTVGAGGPTIRIRGGWDITVTSF
jgi:hypothetical protein